MFSAYLLGWLLLGCLSRVSVSSFLNRYRRLKCRKCSYEDDRDVIGCLNILRMKGAPLPLKAICEAPEAEIEWIVIKC
jgi:hypothetical protein